MTSPYPAKVYRARPADFSSKIEVAACYIHAADRHLLLHRAKGTPQAFTWGVPAGKFEPHETPFEAVKREVQEETGILLKEEELLPMGPLYVRYPHLDFTYHLFNYECSLRPEVSLSDEHHDYRWVSVAEALSLPLISGGAEALQQVLVLRTRPRFPRKAFYFVRHGETDVNANPLHKRVDYDLPLNKRGIEQALAAGMVASKLPLGAIRSSPIQRAAQTRDLILQALELPHCEDDHLGECKAEVWTKMVRFMEGSHYEATTSIQDFLTRVGRGVEAALQEEGPILIVSHGGVHWAICYHFGIEDHPWAIGNGQIVHFRPVGTEGWEASICEYVS